MNDTIELHNLAQCSFEEIAEAFALAFADYSISIDKESLRAMLKRRGAEMELSFGAFHDNRLVSFIFNGIGTYEGLPTAYDTGTGTIKEYRGQGLTDLIFNHSITPLKEAGIKRYLLEVLTENTPAVKIYKRQDFSIIRELVCYGAPNSELLRAVEPRANQQVNLEIIPVATIEQYAPLLDFTPSWQNSFDSIKRNPEAFHCIAAYLDDEFAGYGISETAYGDISQLAVATHLRRKGIGSRLLQELIRHNRIPKAKVLNITSDADAMKLFLEASGFSETCRQFEMAKQLGR